MAAMVHSDSMHPHQTETDPFYEELIHYHARHMNPELWRPSTPSIVPYRIRHESVITGYDYRGKGQAALNAVWQSIHMLLIAYAETSGEGYFSMEQIARLSGVCRSSLIGEHGYIQRLVRLGLLDATKQPYPGKTGYRFVYSINILALEQQTIQTIPEIARDIGVQDPSRHHRSSVVGQTTLPLDELADKTDPTYSQSDQPVLSLGTQPDQPVPSLGTQLDQQPTEAGQPNQPAMDPMSQTNQQNQPARGANRPASPAFSEQIGQQPGGQTDSMREREQERGREGMASPSLFSLEQRLDAFESHIQHLVELIPSLIVTERDRYTSNEEPSQTTHTSRPPLSVEVIPPSPAYADGTPRAPLPASVVELYQGLTGSQSDADRYRLYNLADMFDVSAGGYGAYWLGQAILMADLCCTGTKEITLSYIRSILARWEQQNSWGSDRDKPDSRTSESCPESKTQAHRPVHKQHPEPADKANKLSAERNDATDTQVPCGPAMTIYRNVTGYTQPLCPAQESLINQVVYPEIWQDVCSFWVADQHPDGTPKPRYNPANIEGLMDRYHQRVQNRQVSDRPLLFLPRHVRDPLLERFHAATTPDEKETLVQEARDWLDAHQQHERSVDENPSGENQLARSPDNPMDQPSPSWEQVQQRITLITQMRQLGMVVPEQKERDIEHMITQIREQNIPCPDDMATLIESFQKREMGNVNHEEQPDLLGKEVMATGNNDGCTEPSPE